MANIEHLTEDEARQIKAQRAAQAIIGGDPLVPYDLIGTAKEIVSLRQQLEGAVLAPEVAAVAATLVDLAKRSLPPHISEAQQAEAYLALRRIAGGR